MTHPARALLLAHKRALEAVIAEDAFRCTTAMAKRYLRMVNSDLAKPIVEGRFGTAGKWGPNGLGPAIADIAAQAAFHRKSAAPADRRAA